MGKQTNGIFGAWSGKVGTLVGSSIYGKATIRTYRENISNPQSTGQVTQRTKFSSVNQMARDINSAILVPMWKRFAVGMSQINYFVSTNISEFSSTGVPTWANLKMSQGRLEAPILTGWEASGDNQLNVNVTTPDDNYGLSTDNVYYAVFKQDVVDGVSTLVGAGALVATREVVEAAGYAQIPVSDPDTLTADLAVYLMYRRTDGTYVSDSGYLSAETNI